jgi:hypothetical protein
MVNDVGKMHFANLGWMYPVVCTLIIVTCDVNVNAFAICVKYDC